MGSRHLGLRCSGWYCHRSRSLGLGGSRSRDWRSCCNWNCCDWGRRGRSFYFLKKVENRGADARIGFQIGSVILHQLSLQGWVGGSIALQSQGLNSLPPHRGIFAHAQCLLFQEFGVLVAIIEAHHLRLSEVEPIPDDGRGGSGGLQLFHLDGRGITRSSRGSRRW